MAEIRPFRALRFSEKAGDIAQLTCPPYDIISEDERERYLKQNPHNIIRLELPREGEEPYAQAGKTLESWLEQQLLVLDDAPALFVYEERFVVRGVEKKSIKGLVCRVRLEEWEKGVVLPHEETLSKAKTDRLNLMRATGCNFSSIYSLYFDEDGAVLQRVEAASDGAPLLSFRSDDGVEHRVWRVEDADVIAEISRLFADKKLYIADGHHRYETAVNFRSEMRKMGKVNERHAANYVMMTLVNMEHPGLVVFPTHRILRGLENFDGDAVLEKCREYFDIEKCTEPGFGLVLEERAAGGKTAFAFCRPGSVEILTLKDPAVMDSLLPDASPAYRGLDVTVLHTLILERVLGIDKANMQDQKNLLYTRDVHEALDTVARGEADCAFLINATRVDEIAAVAGAGEKMPQKSTYFYPKLITGHIINPLFD